MVAFRRLLTLVLALALPLLAAAQPTSERNLGPERLLERWEAEAADIERQIGLADATQTDYTHLRAELDEQAARLPALIEQSKAAALPLRQQLDALGPAPEEGGTEAESVAAERARLNGELQQADALTARLSQAKARAETLIAQIIEARRAIFTERLRTRGPSPLKPQTLADGMAAIERELSRFSSEAAVKLSQRQMSEETLSGLVAIFAVLVGALMMLRQVRRWTVARLGRMVATEATQSRRVTVGVLLTLTRLITPIVAIIVALVGAGQSGLVGDELQRFISFAAFAGVLLIAAWALSLAFFAPGAAKLRLSSLDNDAAARAHWWMMALATVVALDRVFVVGGEVMGSGIEGVVVLNAVLLVLGGIALWQVIRQIAPVVAPSGLSARSARSARSGGSGVTGEGTPEDDEDEAARAVERESGVFDALAGLARLFGRISAVLAPVLALAGYYAASRYAFYPLVFSGAVICLCLLLYEVVQAGVEQMLRSGGDARDETQRGRLRLIPVFVGFLLSCAALPVLALIWGANVSDLGLMWRRAAEGVEVGDITVAPTDFFSFLVVFSIGFVLTRLAQSVLYRSVLPYTSLDTGGRDAIRAGVGYVGIIAAALIAIATVGIDLSNLAIAVGALSVGIGFGLQNIVNNFVSGIILLIERPIKTGDWVELTSGSGYVKQINVRSTEIETFDRSSLIVPNSELISSAVVNWTHANNNGRIIVPVGVAYGTDPRRVEKLLLEIAKAHPMLLRRPAPYVLFRHFGTDALEFEIRGVLRDVNWVLNTQSDMNYEIAERFAAEGIEVPFAQRDLHLRNVDELARAIAGRPNGRAGEPDDAIEPGEPNEPGDETGRGSVDYVDEATKRPGHGRAAGFDGNGDFDGHDDGDGSGSGDGR